MPATFAVDAKNLRVVLRELKELDPNLRKELIAEMKSEVAPIQKRLAGGIPGASPLSGFARKGGDVRYTWVQPRGSVLAPLSKRARKDGFVSIVSIKFKSSGRRAGFEIMELAGSKTAGRNARGAAMIRNLNRRFPMRGGLGRFVIPPFKNVQGEAASAAKRVLEKFAAKVNRRLS